LDTYLGKVGLFAFHYGPGGVRRFTIRWLARHDRALADTIIPMAIQDDKLEVRLAALEVVAAYHRRQDVRVLSLALRDRHEAVRIMAAQVLGQYRSAHIGSYLQSALSDPHPEVRAMAAQALGQIPTTRFSPALENALGDKDSQVRASAAEVLGRVGRAEALIPLRAMAARDPVYHARQVADQAVKGLERRTAPPEEKRRLARYELIQILLDNRRPREERLRAKECLIRIKGESMIPMLEQALNATNDTKVHLHIVEILAFLLPCKPLQDTLIGCLHHISAPVRRRAIVALGNIGDRRTIFYLSGLAREADALQNLLGPEDAHLAREAIRKIEERIGR
jgi:HEAT repeat protein